ncbi:MAG: peptidase transporter [Proteobacteria bacterium]|nr:peptidase transporter [Pseudomonadota bacterium]
MNGVNQEINTGESLAIVAPSGQGKTTLAKIVLDRLYPEDGTITVGGIDITQTRFENHRNRIGCVMQDDILFSGSSSENISFFDNEPDHAKITRVARLVQIHSDIMKIPMNYRSLVGDIISRDNLGSHNNLEEYINSQLDILQKKATNWHQKAHRQAVLVIT